MCIGLTDEALSAKIYSLFVQSKQISFCAINSQGVMQSPVVHEHAAIPGDQVIMKAIAMGLPDEDFPASPVKITRRTVDKAARFVGFA